MCAGDIRLVGGSVPSQGRVELFYEGEWGRVFIDGSFSDPATAVARVACRQAGYPYTEGNQSFGQGSGPVWLNIQTCTGDEERLEQCYHLGWRGTSSGSDLGVRCRGECVWCEKDTHIVSRCLNTAESSLTSSHHLLPLPLAADKPPFSVSIEATPFSIFIEWMEPSENIPVITGYNITVENMVTKATWTMYDEGSSREANVTGLTPFMEYSFTVRADYKYRLGPSSQTMAHSAFRLSCCIHIFPSFSAKPTSLPDGR